MQSVKFRSVISPLLFHARARGRRVGQLEAPAGKYERSSQARFGGLTLVSRAPWLLVTGAPGLFSWPNTLWNTAVACRMSPTSRTGQAAASRRHRHRNSRGAAAARRADARSIMRQPARARTTTTVPLPVTGTHKPHTGIHIRMGFTSHSPQKKIHHQNRPISRNIPRFALPENSCPHSHTCSWS